MHIDRCTLDKSSITLLWILPGRVSKEARAKRLSDLRRIPSTRDDSMFVSRHNILQLISNILSSTHRPCLNEILETPRIGELVGFPSIVDIEESEMVTVRIVELGFLLVGLCLLVFGTVEDGLDR